MFRVELGPGRRPAVTRQPIPAGLIPPPEVHEAQPPSPPPVPMGEPPTRRALPPPAVRPPLGAPPPQVGALGRTMIRPDQILGGPPPMSGPGMQPPGQPPELESENEMDDGDEMGEQETSSPQDPMQYKLQIIDGIRGLLKQSGNAEGVQQVLAILKTIPGLGP